MVTPQQTRPPPSPADTEQHYAGVHVIIAQYGLDFAVWIFKDCTSVNESELLKAALARIAHLEQKFTAEVIKLDDKTPLTTPTTKPPSAASTRNPDFDQASSQKGGSDEEMGDSESDQREEPFLTTSDGQTVPSLQNNGYRVSRKDPMNLNDPNDG